MVVGNVSGIEEGSLEIIPLIGLRSPQIVKLLQRYVDKYGDIQTAAYISAYALAFAGINKAKESLAPLKKFINEYKEMLNHLQLWNVRAEFDVALG